MSMPHPHWTQDAAGLDTLEAQARRTLGGLRPALLPAGHVLFRPGEAVRGFVVMLSGRAEVYLTGPTGRELLLYAVEPGQSCVQSTLGLLGGEDYSAEGVLACDSRVVLIPRDTFLSLIDASPGFRAHVFRALAGRMQMMMQLLERVAFRRVEARLAAALLASAEDGEIRMTHQALASRVGTAREVVSRRLEAFARKGWVESRRGRIRLTDRAALREIAALDATA